MESDARKAEFLKHMAFVLELKNCTIVNMRLEAIKSESINMAVSRAFATITKSVLAGNKLFKKGGAYFHFKGSNWSGEIAEMPSQLISMWRPELLGEYSLPVSQGRRAVIRTTRI